MQSKGIASRRRSCSPSQGWTSHWVSSRCRSWRETSTWSRLSKTACMGKGMDFTWSAVKDVRLIFSSSPAQEAPP
ncbi:hypothetical protein DLJ88_01615 [Evtepia gabavorous]|uniref:Uncharacterized protein n=1 Tax=Evtepia gabavorous TaxID=2211183 RepID=A0A3E2B610_9FIRM|nr:hypothetical protein DV520_01615 [Evtepia gabavorous]TYK63601.1 hypothetical protein DLJ88_01615 [Evtepia gabavorous]